MLEQYASPAEVLGRPATPFVADFVGADRGLKRLSVTAIDAADLATLPTVTPASSLAEARRAMDGVGSAWALVVEDGGRLAGALSRAGAEGDGTAADALAPVAASVPAGATLKDAFAELLLHDIGWVAVVDDGRFCGVLTPDALHAAIRKSVAEPS